MMNQVLIDALYHSAIFLFFMIAVIGLCMESVLRR